MRLRWLHKGTGRRVQRCLLGVLLLGGCGPSEGERVRQAREHYVQWQLRDAETTLAPLFEHPSTPADSTALLYAEVLFAQRELLRARVVLQGLVDQETPFHLTALRHLAHTHFFLGQPDTAATFSHRLLALARQQADTLRMAQAHHILGLIGFYRAAYDSALFHQQTSLRLARQVDDVKAEADALRQIGVLYWYRGKNEEALTAYYEPALALYRRIDDKIGEATTLSNIGLVHPKEREANFRLQLQAFGIRKRIGDQVGLSDSYLFLADNPYLQHPDAIHPGHRQRYIYIRQSLALSTRIGYSWGREIAARSLDYLLASRLDYLRIADLGQWVDSVETVSGEGRIHAHHEKALRAYHAGRWEEALTLLRQQKQWLDSLGLPSYQTLGWYILPLRKLERWDEVEQVLREAEAVAPPDSRIQGALGEFFLSTRQPARAEALLIPVVAYYDSLYLSKLFETDPGLAFERAAGAVHLLRSDLYMTLVRALIRQQKRDAFTYMERERSLPFWGERDQGDTQARQVISRFVELMDQYNTDPDRFDDMQTLLAAVNEMQQTMLASQRVLSQTAPPPHVLEVTSLVALQQTLGPEEVFVEYALDRTTSDVLYPSNEEEGLHVLAVRRDTLALFSIDIPPRELETLIDVHRQALLRGRDRPQDTVWKASSHKLYTMLLAPIVERGLLRSGDHLILSPHRASHLVPFHALITTPKTEAPRFIVEDHVVSYVPSATFLVKARHRAAKPFRSLLAVAPDERSLPFSEQEVRSIPDGLFARRKIVRNGDARADQVLRDLEQYDVIHLAAHARMSPSFPLYSHIAFSDRRLELHEILQRTLQARLVVLSACETGRGVGAFGVGLMSENLVSFPRAFLTAGASAVMASLWLVEDAATASLMEKFYQHLSELSSSPSMFQTGGQSAPSPLALAVALTHAQRQFLAEARAAGDKAHPFYWAGFYLTGDGR